MRTLALIVAVLLVQPLFATELQEFTADYEIYYGNLHLGKANYHFSHIEDNHYRFEFVSHLRFLIFFDERVVSSDLTYEDFRLRPRFYSHDRKGTGPDYLEEIQFDRSENIIRSIYKKEIVEFEYKNDIIDGLSVQLQMILDLQRGIKQPRYRILDANKLREREFSFMREESINVLDVEYLCVMYQLVRDNERRTTQIWFSPENDYLPVQMVHFANGKKQFNARLVSFHMAEEDETTRPE